MKLALKISKFIVFLICCTLCLTSCTDDPIDDPIDDPPTEPYTVGPGEEEAFPGIHGEIMEFIVDGDTITVEKINDKYVYQGDVFLTEDQLTSGSKKAAGISLNNNKWHCNTVYYKVNDNLLHKSGEISAAIKHFESNSYLKFKEWTVEINYVEFVWDSAGCASYEGMRGGRQEIWIADWATAGVVIHEIGHAIGLIHEHSRLDRNKYVIVEFSNIIDSEKHNFRRRPALYKSDFDFNSIMLYNSFFFSKDRDTMPTILRKNPFGPYEAKREVLSPGDIDVINQIYPEDPDIYALDSIKDIDGNYYRIIEIGTQVWMAENLKTTLFNDGTSIENETDPWYWSAGDGQYSWYNNDISYKEDYGAIYDWAAVETHKLCPAGWHVPSRGEYLTLIEYVGGIEIGGGILKEKGTSHWQSPNTGATDEYCLCALPGGIRTKFGITYHSGDEDFEYITEDGVWLTSTEEPGGTFYYVGLSYDYQDAGMEQTPNTSLGASIRCIKDE